MEAQKLNVANAAAKQRQETMARAAEATEEPEADETAPVAETAGQETEDSVAPQQDTGEGAADAEAVGEDVAVVVASETGRLSGLFGM